VTNHGLICILSNVPNRNSRIQTNIKQYTLNATHMTDRLCCFLSTKCTSASHFNITTDPTIDREAASFLALAPLSLFFFLLPPRVVRHGPTIEP
jgi:hypothetical protein